MISNFKNAFKEVFGLKFFWIYLFIYAVIQTISTIFNISKNIPHHEHISNIISIIGFICVAYIYTMAHNLLNNKELNEEITSFWQSLGLSVKVWFKALLSLGLCVLLIFSGTLASSILLVVSIMISNPETPYSNIIHTPLFYVIFGFIILITIAALIFIVELVSINFAKDYKISSAFKWIKVVKTFFKKGFAKRTWSILGIEIGLNILFFAILFGTYMAISLTLTYFAKNLLVNHSLLLLFLYNMLNVVIPFIAATLHFMLSSAVCNLLAKTYKESLEVVE